MLLNSRNNHGTEEVEELLRSYRSGPRMENFDKVRIQEILKGVDASVQNYEDVKA